MKCEVTMQIMCILSKTQIFLYNVHDCVHVQVYHIRSLEVIFVSVNPQHLLVNGEQKANCVWQILWVIHA